MPTIDELRKAMGAATVTNRGNYFEGEGSYTARCEKLFYKRSDDGTNKDLIIAEFSVLESNREDVKPGSQRSVVENLANLGAINRVKAMVLALIGCDPAVQPIPDAANVAAMDIYVAMRDAGSLERQRFGENPLGGRLVKVSTSPGKSRAKGMPITNKNWTPCAQPAAAQ